MDVNVALVGAMGSGKSTVGQLLAARLGWTLVDTDALVETAAGRPIRDIFATDGEAVFRRLEEAAVARAARMQRVVIATGGGVPLSPRNRAVLRAHAWVVWLRAPAADLLRRIRDSGGLDQRPLLQDPDPLRRLQAILNSREEAYRASAHWVLDTQGLDLPTVAERILAAYRTRRNGPAGRPAGEDAP